MKILSVFSKKYGTKEIFFDDEDYGIVVSYSWHITKKPKDNIFYARTNIPIENKQTSLYLHRLILGLTDSKILVDHIDHNGLNNQRDNLRVASVQQNARNSVNSRKGTSNYKGVTFRGENLKKPWLVRIKIDGEYKYIGYFADEVEAAKAYNVAASVYFGAFSCPNPL